MSNYGKKQLTFHGPGHHLKVDGEIIAHRGESVIVSKEVAERVTRSNHIKATVTNPPRAQASKKKEAAPEPQPAPVPDAPEPEGQVTDDSVSDHTDSPEADAHGEGNEPEEGGN